MEFQADTIRALHAEIIRGWNARDAAAMTQSWSDDVDMVGFDGSQIRGRAAAAKAIAKIFSDHEVARYVSIVREVRQLAPGVAMLQAHVGMIPPGSDRVMPERNAIQTLVAVRHENSWKTEVFQNTPAKWDGRPADVEALTRELQHTSDG
jgi:uncharacterized protein (TIGR02246 family)